MISTHFFINSTTNTFDRISQTIDKTNPRAIAQFPLVSSPIPTTIPRIPSIEYPKIAVQRTKRTRKRITRRSDTERY